MYSGGEKMTQISTQTTLRTLRKSMDLSLTEVSQAVELTPGVLREIEIGSKSTTILRAERLAGYYGKSIEDLFIPKYFTAKTD